MTPYGHNGYFKTIAGIVRFYNTRDCAKAGVECPQLPYEMSMCPVGSSEAYALQNHCWPEPEVAANVNDAELGNLGLTAAEEADLVAFLKTLNDG